MASVCSRSFPSKFFVFLFTRIFDENSDVNGADASFALCLRSHFYKREGVHRASPGPRPALRSSR